MRNATMHDVHDAIAALRERTGLDSLALDGNGRAALVFDDAIAVEIRSIDERRLELIAPVEEADPAISAARLRALLQANHAGEATGAGRIAIAPDGDVVLCDRIEVAGLDEAGLERRVLDFVRHVALWRSGALEDALDAPKPDEPALPDGDLTFLRI